MQRAFPSSSCPSQGPLQGLLGGFCSGGRAWRSCCCHLAAAMRDCAPGKASPCHTHAGRDVSCHWPPSPPRHSQTELWMLTREKHHPGVPSPWRSPKPWSEGHRALRPGTSCCSGSHGRGRGPTGMPPSRGTRPCLYIPGGVTAQACDLEPRPWEWAGESGSLLPIEQEPKPCWALVLAKLAPPVAPSHSQARPACGVRSMNDSGIPPSGGRARHSQPLLLHCRLLQATG